MRSKEESGLKRLKVPTHVDLELFNKLKEEDLLRSQKHPIYPISIWNYTQKVQFEKLWTEETMMARGLVLDNITGEILARPFKKFFNFEEHFGPLPDGPFDVWEKKDGSLFILFHWSGGWIGATKGSFASEQAVEGMKILIEKYSDTIEKLNKKSTFLFEIIYPENRIVLNYGSVRDLIFLAEIETKSGLELGPDTYYGFPIPEFFGKLGSKENPLDLKLLEVPNKEGFVIKYTSGLRLKLKFDEYIRLHKVMTGFTERNVWESLMRGGREELNRVIDRVPDEFFLWINEVATKLEIKFNEIESTSIKDMVFMPEDTRAIQAAYIKDTKYPRILFAMLDSKPYAEGIWKMIRPVSTEVFRLVI